LLEKIQIMGDMSQKMWQADDEGPICWASLGSKLKATENV
jgi:hypothetical protein